METVKIPFAHSGKRLVFCYPGRTGDDIMKLAVDSSSFAKRYVEEIGSEELELILGRASELAFSVILIPEIVSALNRRLRENVLTVGGYRTVKKQLLEDVNDASVLQVTPSVTFGEAFGRECPAGDGLPPRGVCP
jgi:hypothetical protein